MNLIELYVHEVTRRLPEKTREDIALELYSTIQDMLPDNPSEELIKEELAKLGNPAQLASKYRDHPRHLIGPAFYDHYLTILKMTIPIALVVVLATQVMVAISGYTGETPIIQSIVDAGLNTAGSAFNIIVHTFFWITLVFFTIERSFAASDQNMSFPDSSWKPDDLKKLSSVPKKKAISKASVFGSLLWTAIWAGIYFNATHIIAVFNDGIPVLNQDVLLAFWPLVVILIAIEVALLIYKWVLGQWTNRLAFMNVIYNILFVALFTFIITRPDLLNQEFIPYLTELLNQSQTTNTVNWIIWSSIITLIIFSVIDSFEGFRKAKIRVSNLFTSS
ncbi:HAAS signaling domain-containing protein [Jeotgalibacillus proteolyticus]|uniref:Uncharacterized protein n=1 Tax=Jeotgalibacillus proteolyticus TaxID=2082395 RepID=A0A2S5GD33_9BACL|nr:hypothetical protein [Jeotgalibacillus proteolyticus]PPA70906.1 hypothetical protein C4B60_08960 [Jeotgalibacillus proteolyticus]